MNQSQSSEKSVSLKDEDYTPNNATNYSPNRQFLKDSMNRSMGQSINLLQQDAPVVTKPKLISIVDVSEQIVNQNQLRAVLFTQDAPMAKSRNSMHSSQTRKKNVYTNFDSQESQSKEEDYLLQKQKLIEEMEILEKIDRQNPLNKIYVDLQKKNSALKRTQTVKKKLGLMEMKQQIIQKQRDEQVEVQLPQDGQLENVQFEEIPRNHTRFQSENNDLSLMVKQQGDSMTQDVDQAFQKQFQRPQKKRKSHKEKMFIHIPQRESEFKRQDMCDLDKDIPNNLIEFTPEDFQFLDKTKKMNLKETELDLKQVKQVEMKTQLILKDNLKEKWERVKIKIRMIGKMKMVFDEVKLYGTSHKVETSQKRKEVIADLEAILQQRINIMDNSKAKSKNTWLIHPDSFLSQNWQYVLVFLLFYTALITPLRITFFDDNNEMGWITMDNFINILFLVDITITFNSSYYTETNELIYQRKQVVIHYLKTWFILDILAVFPFEWFVSQNTSSTSYFRLSRIPRTYRLIRMARIVYMVRKMNHNKFMDRIQEYFQLNTGIRRILIFFSVVMVCVHVMACFWYYAAKVEDFGPDTWTSNLGYNATEKFALYTASIYWTVTTISTVGFGDIRAYNDLERVLSCFWMIVGAGFYSFTVGSLSNILTELDTKDAHLQYKISITDEFCKETSLTKETRGKIRKALEYSAMKSVFSQKQRDEFLKEIPLDLKFQVSEAMYENLKAKVAFFKDKESLFIANFVTILHPARVSVGEIIYQKGEHPSVVYFLVSGRVNMVIGMHQITFKTYVQGSYFGEVEIFDSSPRLHTARAEIECDMLTISQVDFLNILKLFPDYHNEVKGTSIEKMKRENEAIRKMQKIANLSFKSKFWQKERTQNIYQTVKERRTILMQEFSSSESDRKDAPHIPSVGSINSRSVRSLQTKKRYQSLKKKLATQNAELLPVDYRHSLIPNIESLDGQTNFLADQNVVYAQSFTVPRHVSRSFSQNYIHIKVSEFQQDQIDSNEQVSQESGTSIQAMENLPIQQLDEGEEQEYLTYSDRYLRTPKQKNQQHEKQIMNLEIVNKQASLATIYSRDAEEDLSDQKDNNSQDLKDNNFQDLKDKNSQDLRENNSSGTREIYPQNFKQTLTQQIKENEDKIDTLSLQFDKIQQRLEKTLRRELMVKESQRFNKNNLESQDSFYTLENVFTNKLKFPSETNGVSKQTQTEEIMEEQPLSEEDLILFNKKKVNQDKQGQMEDFFKLDQLSNQKKKDRFKLINLSNTKPRLIKSKQFLDITNTIDENNEDDGDDQDVSI